jgi:hypothetical protein
LYNHIEAAVTVVADVIGWSDVMAKEDGESWWK